MKNFRNIFKEYQGDPKTFRDLKIGFACLIVLGVLVAFVVSPPLRHSIGIGNSHSVNPPTHVWHQRKHGKNPGQPEGKATNKHNGHRGHAHSNSHPSTTHPAPNQIEGSEGVKTPQESPGGGSGQPAPESPSPGTPSPTHPSENNPPLSNGGSGHVGIEVEIPGVNLPPMVKEVPKDVNKTVNGLTGTLNEVTKEAPVHVEVPPVCVLKC